MGPDRRNPFIGKAVGAALAARQRKPLDPSLSGRRKVLRMRNAQRRALTFPQACHRLRRMPRPSRGILLVVISGAVSILLLASLALMGITRAFSRSAAGAMSASLGRAAAASGAEYACSRLWREEPYPRAGGSPATRGDDWTFRDAWTVPPGRSANPSYSHGECWSESGGDGRAYDGGADALPPEADRDGDGRFGAWSGRLRGGSAPFSLRFSLKIQSAGGKIPLNGGWLTAGDRDGVDNNASGVTDETGEDRNQSGRTNGVDDDDDGQVDEADEATPDHRDGGFAFHAGLQHVLNNLGARVLPAGHPRLWTIATSSPLEPISYSRLGSDLILNRPPGGYRTAGDLKSALLALGYPIASSGDPQGLAEILPFLDLSIPFASPQAGPSYTAFGRTAFMPVPQVELATADRIVLESLLRYLGSSGIGYPWEDPALAVPDPRTNGAVAYQASRFLLFPDEARRIADLLLRRRETLGAAARSWNGLYAAILSEAESLEPSLYASPGSDAKLFRSGLDPAAHPAAHARYAQAKGDIAFSALCPFGDPYPSAAPKTWSGWGIPRPTGLGGPDLPFVSQCGIGSLCRIALPSPGPDYAAPADPFTLAGAPIWPLSLAMGPLRRFDVEVSASLSGGGAAPSAQAEVRGSLSVQPDPALTLSTQQDFENPGGGFPELARYGILEVRNDAVWASSPGDLRRRGLDRDDMGTPLDNSDDRIYRHMASLPGWDRGSYPAGLTPPAEYSRTHGALALAAREGGPFDAELYFALGETDAGIVFGVDQGETTAGFPSESNPPAPAIRVNPPVAWGVSINPNVEAGKPTFTPYFLTSRQENANGLLFRETAPVHPALLEGFPSMRNGLPIETLTIEGWLDGSGALGQNAQVRINRDGNATALRLFALPVEGPVPGIEVFLESNLWMMIGAPSESLPMPERRTLFSVQVPDAEPGSKARHIALTMAYSGMVLDPWTDLWLYVDGTLRWSGSVYFEFGNSFALGAYANERLTIRRVDDLRIYRRRLRNYAEEGLMGPNELANRFRTGRFVKKGTYISPLYVLDADATLRHCQWTGMTSPSFKDAVGIGIPDPFAVRVKGYWDADGTNLAHEEPLPATGTVYDLLAEGMPPGIRSFRYEVAIDATAAAGPMLDTPVFRTLWLSYRRKGAANRWDGWTWR